MAPERPPLQISCRSKPYIRDTFDLSPSVQKCRPVTPSGDPISNKKGTDGQMGFPTLTQYHTIEQGYIDSLTPRRQAKALISQALFDRIWHVLRDDHTVKENAQFRFWVRKMFTLGEPCTVSGAFRSLEREVVLHGGLLVAVREQIYELLCYYHGSAKHGGRDKTCAYLRRHYTWVPKDLVAQFVRACPTCNFKRYGRLDGSIIPFHPGTLSNSPPLPSDLKMPQTKKECSSPILPPFGGFSSDTDNLDTLFGPFPSTLITPYPHFTLPLPFGQIQANQLKDRCNRSLSCPSNTPIVFPTSWPVPLHKEPWGGWQYQRISYMGTNDECAGAAPVHPMSSHNPPLGRVYADIPDATVLFKPCFQDAINFKVEENHSFFGGQPSVSTSSPLANTTVYSLSPSLAASSTVGGGSPGLQIDPFLIGLSMSGELTSSGDISPISRKVISLSDVQSRENALLFTSLHFPSGLDSANRAEVLSPPNFLACDSFKTFRDFLATAEDASLGQLVYGNNVSGTADRFWHGEDRVVEEDKNWNSSPESSVRSDISDLSLGAGTSGGGSPASINTPVIAADGEARTADILGLYGGNGKMGGPGLGIVVQPIPFGGLETWCPKE